MTYYPLVKMFLDVVVALLSRDIRHLLLILDRLHQIVKNTGFLRQGGRK
jgi:hypothetical protein